MQVPVESLVHSLLGCAVQLHQLSDAAQYNGASGTVVEYIEACDRYLVRLDSGGTVRARPQNLSFVKILDDHDDRRAYAQAVLVGEGVIAAPGS